MVQPSFYFYSFMKLKVLFAVLNWGLGHATRSETLIKYLSKRGFYVTIASSGLALEYLKLQFPTNDFLELPDRDVIYSRAGASIGLFKRAIIQKELNKKQNDWTQTQLKKGDFDIILSDNVYGVHSSEIFSVLITHQLKPLSPLFQGKIMEEIADWVNRFDEVWIPDFEGEAIAGEMLNNPQIQIPKQFLGNTSRFSGLSAIKDINFLGIISGPEPLAGAFNEIVLKKFQSSASSRNTIAYSGEIPKETGEVEFAELNDNQNLNQLASRSQFIICRSGFTSLLDILKIKGNALIVPTPGQPEQAYLAQRMLELKLTHSISQRGFKRAELKPFDQCTIDDKWSVSNLDKVINRFLKTRMPSAE